jgi:hypothetical protein
MTYIYGTHGLTSTGCNDEVIYDDSQFEGHTPNIDAHKHQS